MTAMLIPTTLPEDMDSSAMLRRAHAAGVQLETYDPDQLLRDVIELLRGRGLNPELPPYSGRVGMAAGAAGQMLRAFGILPVADPYDQYNRSDPESR